MTCSMLSQSVALLKLMLTLFYMSLMKGRELYLGDFVKLPSTLAIIQTLRNLFFFKLGMMLDKTKLYRFITV